ncbi:MAG TPA: hypothetical protein VGJ04_00995 [Pirellulales bacterium]|jgi:hypothetical protein
MGLSSTFNPWNDLPDNAPYVLDSDGAIIEAHNARLETDSLFKVHLSVLPEPFLGRPDAPVVLLNLNPGWNKDKDPVNHSRPEFIKRNRGNLLHKPSDYPFYLLDPKLRPNRTNWWEERLGSLIQAVGLEAVAQNVLCVEYFPYHSKRYKKCERLPSQDYSFTLARDAVERNAVILLMRGKRRWTNAVPSLSSYNRLFFPSSFQCAYVSPNNYSAGFGAAVKEIRAKAK